MQQARHPLAPALPAPPCPRYGTRAARRSSHVRRVQAPLQASDGLLRSVLGNSLQGGAARAVILLGVFSALGAIIAWLVR